MLHKPAASGTFFSWDRDSVTHAPLCIRHPPRAVDETGQERDQPADPDAGSSQMQPIGGDRGGPAKRLGGRVTDEREWQQ